MPRVVRNIIIQTSVWCGARVLCPTVCGARLKPHSTHYEKPHQKNVPKAQPKLQTTHCGRSTQENVPKAVHLIHKGIVLYCRLLLGPQIYMCTVLSGSLKTSDCSSPVRKNKPGDYSRAEIGHQRVD